MSAYRMKGKMVKHKLLAQRSVLRPYLPETYWFTARRARRMLQSSRSIFIKPNYGSGGTGIIKVSRLEKKGYLVRKGQKRIKMKSSALSRVLWRYQRSGNRYIVQKGLNLGRYKGKIFDVRVYLQKPRSKWIISGIAARVAAANRFVTNHHQGGHAVKMNKVLASLFPNHNYRKYRCLKTLRRTVLIAADTLDDRFTDIRELGIDFGIESSGRVWFIEANSRPLHRLFTQLSDKTMLNRIRKIKRYLQKKAETHG